MSARVIKTTAIKQGIALRMMAAIPMRERSGLCFKARILMIKPAGRVSMPKVVIPRQVKFIIPMKKPRRVRMYHEGTETVGSDAPGMTGIRRRGGSMGCSAGDVVGVAASDTVRSD